MYPSPFPRAPSFKTAPRLEQRVGCRHDARLLVCTCGFCSPLPLALVHLPLPGTTHLRTYKHGQAARTGVELPVTARVIVHPLPVTVA
jgi:hypothetical protein